MSTSNRNGTGFEFAAARAIEDEITYRRNSLGMRGFSELFIVHDERFSTLFNAYTELQRLNPALTGKMYSNARKGAVLLLDAEPALWQGNPNDAIRIFANRNGGEEGDVRDIYIERLRGGAVIRNIGVSLKWNHDAVKHSRISPGINFGSAWMDNSASDDYWHVSMPIFNRLLHGKEQGMLWRQIANKSTEVYSPLCCAIINELQRIFLEDPSYIQSFVRYIVGRRDFHKLIAKPKGEVILKTFSFDGTLKQPIDGIPPSLPSFGRTPLPTELIGIDLLRNNTIRVIFNNGWGFSMRLHNASSRVEPSLKFDIQTIGDIPVETVRMP